MEAGRGGDGQNPPESPQSNSGVLWHYAAEPILGSSSHPHDPDATPRPALPPPAFSFWWRRRRGLQRDPFNAIKARQSSAAGQAGGVGEERGGVLYQ